jgi:hypothetical protein
VRSDHVLVSPGDDEYVITGFYHLPDEVFAAVRSAIRPMNGDPPGFTESCLHAVMLELFKGEDGWYRPWNTLSVLRVPLRDRVVLVVSNTPRAHRKVKQVLENLQKTHRLPDELLRKLNEIQELIRHPPPLPVGRHWGGLPPVG